MAGHTPGDADAIAGELKKWAAHLDAVSDDLKNLASRFEKRLNDVDDVAPDDKEGRRYELECGS
jgi:hypothetical protein